MNIGQINSKRVYWMGLAMMWIILYHIDVSCQGIMLYVKKMGYGGVDIFIFASGLGNYYSYNKDKSPLDFLKRRISRLAPTYLPFIVMYETYVLVTGKPTPNQIVGCLLGIQGFTGNGGEFNWYLTCIILCYLLTPYLASFVKRNPPKKNSVVDSRSACNVLCVLE